MGFLDIAQSLLPDVTSIINNERNIKFQRDANKQNLMFQQQANEQNIQLQRDINQQNLEQQWKMWDATNDYNSPVSQMARYREAGLNPNLIYGQSNTTSAANVGNSVAPNVQPKNVQALQSQQLKMDTVNQYLSLMAQKESLHKQEIENKILDHTYQEKITQSGLETRQMILNTFKSIGEIEQIGLDNNLKKLDSQIKEFEISIQPIRKSILESEGVIKGNQALESSINVETAKANQKLAEFAINLEYSKYLLINAQTEHELEKIGVTLEQKNKLLKEIDTLEKELDVMSSKIDVGESQISLNEKMGEYYGTKKVTDAVGTVGDVIDSVPRKGRAFKKIGKFIGKAIKFIF